VAILVVLGLFIILLVLGIPICYAVGIPSMVYFLAFRPELLTIVPLRVFAGVDAISLIALPLFITMGLMMNAGGLTQRIIDVAMIFFGRIAGGLGLVNVAASMVFGGISGSSVADTASIGAVLIPEMTKKGYRKRIATGITVASSTVGMIIPPSVPMVIYAVASSTSVGRLFLAGATPGIMIGVFMLIITYVLGRWRKWPREERRWSRRESVKKILLAIPAVGMPVFIVGVIVLGIATPTEAAGLGVLYALVFGMFVYRELKPRMIPKILKEAVYTSASIMMIVTFSSLFGWILINEHVPGMMADVLFSLHLPNAGALLLFAALLFFVGDFIDVAPAILLLTPIFLPAMMQMGISPIQFGAVLIVGLAIGLATPPVGQCLNVANKVSGMDIIQTCIGSLPWLMANAVTLILLCVFPQLSLWLGDLFY